MIQQPQGEGHRTFPYHSRGWTYQEFLLAKRRLILINGEVHWYCRCKEYIETLIGSLQPSSFGHTLQLQVCSNGFADLGSLDSILGSYPEKDLTHQSDTLAAIAGLLTILGQSFPGGFLFGLAETCFERSLCWYRDRSGRGLRRRELPSADRQAQQSAQDPKLPSWSYLSWVGASVHWECSDTVRQDQVYYKGYYAETHPITVWSTSASPRNTARRRLQSRWYEIRESCRRLARDPAATLPEGWTRYVEQIGFDMGTIGHHVVQQAQEEVCFEHNSLDINHPFNRWFMPFPVAKLTDSAAACMSLQTPYLFCKTTRSFLWPSESEDASDTVNLMNSEGLIVGVLIPHSRDQLQDLFSDDDTSSGGTTSTGAPLRDGPFIADNGSFTADTCSGAIELVAVCGKQTYQDCEVSGWEDWQRAEPVSWCEKQPLFSHQSYLVLWIEWVDGIAYRLGRGEVEKTAWENLSPDTIELCLG